MAARAEVAKEEPTELKFSRSSPSHLHGQNPVQVIVWQAFKLGKGLLRPGIVLALNMSEKNCSQGFL